MFEGTFAKEPGELIDLYDERTVQDVSSGLSTYHSQAEVPAVHAKRDWRDCKNLTTVQKVCCGTAHAFGDLVKNVSLSALVTT